MNLETILLGLLRSPASGYDLHARLDRRCRHFWSASLSQIYPLLARMEDQGLLHSGMAPSRRGPARKLHGLTDEGRVRLSSTLQSAPHMGVERLPWLAEVSLAGAHNDANGARNQLTRLHQHFTRRCDSLQTELEDQPSEPAGPDTFFERATLSCALATARAQLAWCEQTLMTLDRVPWQAAQPPGDPSGPGASQGSD
jgi:DNA-binding PadR family transcriptional regulator